MKMTIREDKIFRHAMKCMQVIILSLTVTACAVLSSDSSFFPVADTPENYSVHAYYNWLASADTEEIEAELARLEGTERDLTGDVQLALVYSVPGDAGNERERMAAELLSTIEPQDSFRFDRRAGAYSDFARIWRDVLQQRQALRSAGTEQMEALKEENRRLQEQIDALTNIEQQLIEREQSQGR